MVLISSFPLVSVVITAYNAEKYIEEAIESVLNQTYPNIECIVVDDGSTDRTEAIVGKFLPRIRYIRQVNQGCSAARNRGASSAQGRYLAFLDYDDLFLPEKITRQVDVMESAPDIIMCYTNAKTIDSEGNRIDEKYVERHPSNPPPSGHILASLFSANFITLSSSLCRTTAFNRSSKFEIGFHGAEDYLLWLYLSTLGRIEYVNEILTCWRRHGNNASGSSTRMDFARLEARRLFLEKAPHARNITGNEFIKRVIEERSLGAAWHYIVSREGRTARKLLHYGLRENPVSPTLWRAWIRSWLPL